jgi:hypothetical protein
VGTTVQFSARTGSAGGTVYLKGEQSGKKGKGKAEAASSTVWFGYRNYVCGSHEAATRLHLANGTGGRVTESGVREHAALSYLLPSVLDNLLSIDRVVPASGPCTLPSAMLGAGVDARSTRLSGADCLRDSPGALLQLPTHLAFPERTLAAASTHGMPLALLASLSDTPLSLHDAAEVTRAAITLLLSGSPSLRRASLGLLPLRVPVTARTQLWWTDRDDAHAVDADSTRGPRRYAVAPIPQPVCNRSSDEPDAPFVCNVHQWHPTEAQELWEPGARGVANGVWLSLVCSACVVPRRVARALTDTVRGQGVTPALVVNGMRTLGWSDPLPPPPTPRSLDGINSLLRSIAGCVALCVHRYGEDGVLVAGGATQAGLEAFRASRAHTVDDAHAIFDPAGRQLAEALRREHQHML